eukprot:5270138-Alexandrium_andersonii.AAC.1
MERERERAREGRRRPRRTAEALLSLRPTAVAPPRSQQTRLMRIGRRHNRAARLVRGRAACGPPPTPPPPGPDNSLCPTYPETARCAQREPETTLFEPPNETQSTYAISQN